MCDCILCLEISVIAVQCIMHFFFTKDKASSECLRRIIINELISHHYAWLWPRHCYIQYMHVHMYAAMIIRLGGGVGYINVLNSTLSTCS